MSVVLARRNYPRLHRGRSRRAQGSLKTDWKQSKIRASSRLACVTAYVSAWLSASQLTKTFARCFERTASHELCSSVVLVT